MHSTSPAPSTACGIRLLNARQGSQQSRKFLAASQQLPQMLIDQNAKGLRSSLGKAHQGSPPIAIVSSPLHQPGLLRPIHQLHRAVVSQAHPFRKVGDGGRLRLRQGADHLQQLILLRLDAAPFAGRFAEAQKAAQLKAELRQLLQTRHLQRDLRFTVHTVLPSHTTASHTACSIH